VIWRASFITRRATTTTPFARLLNPISRPLGPKFAPASLCIRRCRIVRRVGGIMKGLPPSFRKKQPQFAQQQAAARKQRQSPATITAAMEAPAGRSVIVPQEQPQQPQGYFYSWPGPGGLPSTPLGAAVPETGPPPKPTGPAENNIAQWYLDDPRNDYRALHTRSNSAALYDTQAPPSPPEASAPATQPVSVSFGMGTESGATTQSDAAVPAEAAPIPAELVARGTTGSMARGSLLSGSAVLTLDPEPRLTIASADREELIGKLDAIQAGIQQIMPTLEAIRGALSDPSIGHNNPPEPIAVPPLDPVDIELTTAAVTAARIEFETQQTRADILRLSALSLQKVGTSVSLWLSTKADVFAEAFAKSAGTEAGKRLIQWGVLLALLHQLVGDLGEVAMKVLQIVGH
jgi:hypothetical protein